MLWLFTKNFFSHLSENSCLLEWMKEVCDLDSLYNYWLIDLYCTSSLNVHYGHSFAHIYLWTTFVTDINKGRHMLTVLLWQQMLLSQGTKCCLFCIDCTVISFMKKIQLVFSKPLVTDVEHVVVIHVHKFHELDQYWLIFELDIECSSVFGNYLSWFIDLFLESAMSFTCDW